MVLDNQPYVLGFLLRAFPKFTFTMSDLDGRLRLQRLIYLMQAHDIYLGYDFPWWLRGPYDVNLTAAGFILEDFYHLIPPQSDSGFAGRTIQRRLDEFAGFIAGREGDSKYLETASSLHFLLSVTNATDSEVIRRVAGNASRPYVEDVLAVVKARLTIPAGVVRQDMDAPGGVVLGAIHASTMSPDMGRRHTDRAIHQTMQDAIHMGERLELVGSNVFRPAEKRPAVDDFVVDDVVALNIARYLDQREPV